MKKLKEENEKIATNYRQLETVKNELLIENERFLRSWFYSYLNFNIYLKKLHGVFIS